MGDLDLLWKTFSQRMAEIELDRRVTLKVSELELKNLREHLDLISANKLDQGAIVQGHNIYFLDLVTREHRFSHQFDLSIDEIIKRAILRRNRQFQWLLVSAYEEFEAYIRALYIGLLRLDIKLALKDGHAKAIETGVNLTTNLDFRKSFDCEIKIFKGLAERFRVKQLLLAKEKGNPAISPWLILFLIERMRHLIVHKGGEVECSYTFALEVLKQSELNGYKHKEDTEKLRAFYLSGQLDKQIYLLGFSRNIADGFEIKHCFLEVLLERLVGIAHVVHEAACDQIGTE